ncbi:hypothetical protein SLS62_011340 [Diatrype stigma]|uniref:Amidoligase enzyme-domain-containing protein n=1 Tax=Diatrype stigma TaxID=117547 RepID=A0AAN9UCD5_9PEZI
MSQNDVRLTFGVEVECLVPWVFVGQQDPQADVKGLPSVIRVSKDDLKHRVEEMGDPDDAVGEIIFEQFRSTFNELGLISTLTSTRPDNPYTQWQVEGDASVDEVDSLGYGTDDSEFDLTSQWVAVEIQSPAEYATPEGFEAIRSTLGILTQKYRMRVNETCSIHVHVGQGNEPFPLHMIRRIAALSYAAELLLFTLHDPLRRVNTWCKPMREYSNLARGLPDIPYHAGDPNEPGFTTNCLRYLGADVRHGEEPISWREKHLDEETIKAFERTRQPGHFEPFQGIVGPSNPQDNGATPVPQPRAASNEHDQTIAERVRSVLTTNPLQENDGDDATSRHQPARTRKLPRIALPRYTDAEIQQLTERLEDLTGDAVHRGVAGEPRGTGVGAFAGAARIFAAPSSCHVAEMVSSATSARGSINFEHYLCGSVASSRGASSTNSKRTVEFRLGEGSLEGAWVAAWARVCVGFVEFALFAGVDEYLEVLARCEAASERDGVYDVLDLLDDLGLYAEAQIAEERIAQKSKEWGMKFVE